MTLPRLPAALRAWRPRPRPTRRPPPSIRNSSSPPTGPQTRTSRILSRLPPSLQKHTAALRKAPLSHLISFLILHELTAVVPLLGLFALFHYTPYTPVGYVTEHWSGHVRDGVARFERYFRRKGWFGFGGDDAPVEPLLEPARTRTEVRTRESSYEDRILKVSVHATVEKPVETEGSVRETRDLIRGWEAGDGKYKLLADVALAWAITKAFLPVRILASVWATPWFAGVMMSVRHAIRRR